MIVLRTNHRESPCGRGAEGTPQGARPSEEGWDRSQCRFDKAQALEPSRSITVPLRTQYRSLSDPLQLPYSFFTARYALLRPCTGSVPTPTKIRLISVTMPRSPSGILTLLALRCYGLPLPLSPPLPLVRLPPPARYADRRHLLFRALPDGRPPRKAQRRNGPPGWTGPGGGVARLASAGG